MNFFQRRKKLKGVNYLVLTPFRRFEHELKEDGLVTVLTPRFEQVFMKKFLNNSRKTAFVPTHLDALGSEVWLAMDGEKNVTSLCKVLDEKLGEKISPVEERVTRFLTQLYLDRFISFKEVEDRS